MGKSILKTVKLSKSYGIAQILNDINFNLNQGDYVAVMGPSGAGKSTFMHMISGMDRPTSGQVYIGENELAGMNDKEIADLRLKKDWHGISAAIFAAYS
uniref:ATP-binding cassette domain-containing protein n=1 Tax=Clostridium sp. NkU-1 TaxID=1095009 RepID=UPI0006D215B7